LKTKWNTEDALDNEKSTIVLVAAALNCIDICHLYKADTGDGKKVIKLFTDALDTMLPMQEIRTLLQL